jgi:hypothetical protein
MARVEVVDTSPPELAVFSAGQQLRVPLSLIPALDRTSWLVCVAWAWECTHALDAAIEAIQPEEPLLRRAR